MTYLPYRAGQRLTAGMLNESDTIGRIVFRATRDNTQSISNSGTPLAANAISWETIAVDLLGGWSAANPTRWTCPKTAYYQLFGGVGFVASAAGSIRGAHWFVNGAAFIASGSQPMVTVPTATILTADPRVLPVQISAGSYVELVPQQNSGAALNTTGSAFRPIIGIMYCGTT